MEWKLFFQILALMFAATWFAWVLIDKWNKL